MATFLKGLEMADEPKVVNKCGVKGCKRAYRAKGYCAVHYQKWRRGELPKGRHKTCSQEDCKKKVLERGLCDDHYETVYKKSKAS